MVPREVPPAVVRAKLRAISNDVVIDVVKITVIVALLAIGIALRVQPMPARVVGAGPLIFGVALLAVWGKQAANRDALRERRLTQSLLGAPYPISGFAIWLAADLPVFEILFEGPIDPELLAEPGVTKLDERTVRVAMPGDPKWLALFLDRWGAKVVSIDMGGTMK